MAHLPRVSVCIPVYNGEAFLSQAIESVLAQTFTDFELIISDNASTDGTADLCRRYAAADRRIQYSRNSVNVGGPENYNRLFHMARGRYIKWLADDDLCAPEFLQQCVDVLDSQPHVILCYPSTKVIGAHGQELNVAATPCFVDPQDIIRRFRHFLNPVGIAHNPVFGLIRRQALEQTFLFRKHLCSDRCLMAQLALMGEFHELPERLLVRRKHDRNISNSPQDLSFYDPQNRHSRLLGYLPELHVTGTVLSAIRSAPLRPGMKMKLRMTVGRWLVRRRSDLWWQSKLVVSWTARRCLARLMPRRKPATFDNS
ncbi:MAG: glycosyltransferase family 2 protein [Planctomycetaceae bacterium]|nr:glycosyltransferase [Planctomycetaceae bacterium]